MLPNPIRIDVLDTLERARARIDAFSSRVQNISLTGQTRQGQLPVGWEMAGLRQNAQPFIQIDPAPIDFPQIRR